MKRFLFTILFVFTLFLSACSKQQDSTAFPEDLIVVLPDGKELSLYMPHDDAAEILGAADYMDDYVGVGELYIYEDLGLDIGYNKDFLVYLSVDKASPCTLKNGLNPSSGKSDFVKAGFSDSNYGDKYYLINDGHFTPILITEPPATKFSFRSAATILLYPSYGEADSPFFGGYSITIGDYHCLEYGWD